MTRFYSRISTRVELVNVTPAVSGGHVLWLRQHCPFAEKAHRLKKEMENQAFSVVLRNVFDCREFSFANTDLILLDACDRVDGTIETIVTRIRMESLVPIIMLADGYSIDQLVAALTTGADAIWTLNTPVEVLIARFKAMLRRHPRSSFKSAR